MSYKVVARYGSSKPGAKPSAWAVVDSYGVEVKRELHKENAQREAQRLNREHKSRHMTRI